MRIQEIITDEFEEEVIRQFCALHMEIAEEEEIRDACKIILKYMTPLG